MRRNMLKYSKREDKILISITKPRTAQTNYLREAAQCPHLFTVSLIGKMYFCYNYSNIFNKTVLDFIACLNAKTAFGKKGFETK